MNQKKPEMITLQNGTKEWRLDGKLHREDGPAIERTDETKEWFRNGLRHREDGPAIEYTNGTKKWYQNGKRHREDGPSVIYIEEDYVEIQFWDNEKKLGETQVISIEQAKKTGLIS